MAARPVDVMAGQPRGAVPGEDLGSGERVGSARCPKNDTLREQIGTEKNAGEGVGGLRRTRWPRSEICVHQIQDYWRNGGRWPASPTPVRAGADIESITNSAGQST